MEPIDAVLFDFSGTLAEEPVLFPADVDVPGPWRDIWDARFAEPGFADSWQRGEIPAAELIADLSKRFGTRSEALREHIEHCTERITFYPGIMKFVRARRDRGQPQALVTVNPDLFDLIAQHFHLDALFDTIVLSAREGTIDKLDLCRIALDRLGGRDTSSALLIDNVAENIRTFEEAGGYGYHFVDDATFVADLTLERLPPSLRA